MELNTFLQLGQYVCTVLINLVVPFGNSTYKQEKDIECDRDMKTGSRNTVYNLLRSHVRVDPNEKLSLIVILDLPFPHISTIAMTLAYYLKNNVLDEILSAYYVT